MHFTLFSIIIPLFVLTTFVHSAPTTPVDSATLLNNALEAQKLNAQFQSVNNTTTNSCTNGDTTCVQDAIATCINGQFDNSQGGCPASQHCFALPSLNSSGTTIACTSDKNALSLIGAAGASGGITGSDSGSGSSLNPASTSSTLNGTTSSTVTSGTATSTNSITPTSTTGLGGSVVTVTVTVQVPPSSSTTTLPSVTQTLSPEEASSLLSSLLAQGASVSTTSGGPSVTLSSTVSAATTNSSDIPTATPNLNYPNNNNNPSESSTTVSSTATNIPSSASASPSVTPVVNTAGSPTGLGSPSGGGVYSSS